LSGRPDPKDVKRPRERQTSQARDLSGDHRTTPFIVSSVYILIRTWFKNNFWVRDCGCGGRPPPAATAIYTLGATAPRKLFFALV